MKKSDVTVLASAARTTTTTSGDFGGESNGAHIVLDVTAASGTPSITFKVQGKDVVSGKYYDILTSAAITGVSTNVLKVYPSITPAANAAVSDVLPHVWRIVVTHGTSDSITYSVGASVME